MRTSVQNQNGPPARLYRGTIDRPDRSPYITSHTKHRPTVRTAQNIEVARPRDRYLANVLRNGDVAIFSLSNFSRATQLRGKPTERQTCSSILIH